MQIRHKLKLGAVQTLETPELRLASDYYNEAEMASLKKPKTKKKKIRKKILKVCSEILTLADLIDWIMNDKNNLFQYDSDQIDVWWLMRFFASYIA